MARFTPRTAWLFAVVVLLFATVAPTTNAFQTAPIPLSTTSNRNRLTLAASPGKDFSKLQRQAAKPKAREAKKKQAALEQEREKKDGLGLFLLYMTPWRNPNSIFVYLLAALYFLGKYSEAQSAARAASGL